MPPLRSLLVTAPLLVLAALVATRWNAQSALSEPPIVSSRTTPQHLAQDRPVVINYGNNKPAGVPAGRRLEPQQRTKPPRGVKGASSSSSPRPSSRRRLPGGMNKEPTESILQFLAGKKDFSDLFDLVIRAGLAGALESPGPFTLFSPSNKAFDNLPSGVDVVGSEVDISKLLFRNDEFLPHLSSFLLNHLSGGQLLEDDLTEGLVIGSFAGEGLQFNILPNERGHDVLFVNGIEITSADNLLTNGVSHQIDAATLSPSWVFSTLTFRTVQIGDTNTLFALLNLAGIDLTVPGEFTLIAPVNAAFAALPEDTQACLVNPANIESLQDVLKFHVLKGVITGAEFIPDTSYRTLEGGRVKVTASDVPSLLFEGIANPLAFDILANNGVVHLIDAVLDPKTACDFNRSGGGKTSSSTSGAKTSSGGGGGGKNGGGGMSSKGARRGR